MKVIPTIQVNIRHATKSGKVAVMRLYCPDGGGADIVLTAEKIVVIDDRVCRCGHEWIAHGMDCDTCSCDCYVASKGEE